MESNVQKIREALANLTRWEESDIKQLECLAKRAIDNDIYGGGILQDLCGAIRDGKRALEDPPRNCDVGTAEEQKKRYRHYSVDSRIENGYPTKVHALAWAQMPYESEAKLRARRLGEKWRWKEA